MRVSEVMVVLTRRAEVSRGRVTVTGVAEVEAGVEEQFAGDSPQQRLVDLLLPLGGAVRLQLLRDP